jgi:hypothetical protein
VLPFGLPAGIGSNATGDTPAVESIPVELNAAPDAAVVEVPAAESDKPIEPLVF